MLARVDPSFDVLLQRAKSGDTVALGPLLDSYRAIWDGRELIAPHRISYGGGRFRCRSGDEPQSLRGLPVVFKGATRRCWSAWLREILKNLVLNLLKNQEDRVDARSRWRPCSSGPARRPTGPWRPRGPARAPRHRGGSRRY